MIKQYIISADSTGYGDMATLSQHEFNIDPKCLKFSVILLTFVLFEVFSMFDERMMFVALNI